MTEITKGRKSGYMSILAVLVFTLFVIMWFSSFAKAATIYVGSGEAHTTIQAGIDAAAGGDVVVVRLGIYKGVGNKNINFSGKAITVRSENGPENTIIDCENDGRGFYFHRGETSSSIVDGFTIKNGNADKGGGIYCNSSSPTIVKCTITGNTASDRGGGVECSNSSSPTIANCTFSDNSAVYGGGMCNVQTSSPTVTNCTFKNNSATWGGGMSNHSSSSPTVTECIFETNSAESGGGIYCTEVSSPTIVACIISGNQASGNIGGIHCYRGAAPVIINCIITGNSASGMGGGIGCQDYATPTIINCTITNNQAGQYGGGLLCLGYESWPTMTNCILWGNTSPEVCPGTGTTTISYCDIDQDGYAGSDGNIREDPRFYAPENGDYHLSADSPCIDTGSSEGAPVDDIDGDPRPYGDNVEIGADEYVPYVCSSATDCDDGNPCTIDECEPWHEGADIIGCVHELFVSEDGWEQTKLTDFEDPETQKNNVKIIEDGGDDKGKIELDLPPSTWTQSSSPDFINGGIKDNIDTSNDELKLLNKTTFLDQQQDLFTSLSFITLEPTSCGFLINCMWCPNAAQAFVTSRNGWINKVALRLYPPPSITYVDETICIKDGDVSPGVSLGSATSRVTEGSLFEWPEFVFSQPVAVYKHKTYWISPLGPNVIWHYAVSDFYPSGVFFCGNSSITYIDACFKTYIQYWDSGHFVSQALDTGADNSAWGVFQANHYAPPGDATIVYKTQSRNSNGSWSNEQTVANGQNIPSPKGRYLRIHAYLTAIDGHTNPVVHNFSVNYTKAGSGHFVSKSKDFGPNISQWNIWGNFKVDEYKPSGTNIQYTTQASDDGVNWDPEVEATSGQPVRSHRKQYLRWKAYLSTNDATISPAVKSVTIYQNCLESAVNEATEDFEDGKAYRSGFHAGDQPASYKDIMLSWVNQGAGAKLDQAEDKFRKALKMDPINYYARDGLLDTLLEKARAHTIFGNEHLINALKMRFPPGENPNLLPAYCEIALLGPWDLEDPFYGEECNLDFDPPLHSTAIDEFGTAIDILFQEIGTGFGIGNFRTSEYQALTFALDRKSLSSIEKAGRLFRKAMNDEVSKEEAVEELRNGAMNLYLESAVLASMQSEEGFINNGGKELKKHQREMREMYQKIINGLNPFGYREDYIPFQAYERLKDTVDEKIVYARPIEQAAREAQRYFDNNQERLSSELADQRYKFGNELYTLTGLDVDDYDIYDPESVQQFKNDAVANTDGIIGQQLLLIDESDTRVELANTRLQNIPKMIEIEQERVGIVEGTDIPIAKVLVETGERLNALDIAAGLANAYSYGTSDCQSYGESWNVGIGFIVSVGFGKSEGTSQCKSETYNPGSIFSGWANGQKGVYTALKNAQIEGINSRAKIRNILLEGVERGLELELSVEQHNQNTAKLESLVNRVDKLIDDWIKADQDIAASYYTDPTFRLLRDDAVIDAEREVRAVAKQAYLAIKALEYEWVEKFNWTNPYVYSYTTNDIFDLQTLNYIQTYMSSFVSVDSDLCEDTSINFQECSTPISLRQDIFGFSDIDPDTGIPYGPDEVAYNIELFKTKITQCRVPNEHNPDNDDLVIDFGTSIADAFLFNPYLGNCKIIYLKINLEGGDGLNHGLEDFAWVYLTQKGTSSVRTLDANWPDDDDLVEYDLDWYSKSNCGAWVQASLRGFDTLPPEIAQNVALENRSIAAATWTLWITTTLNENEYLNLSELEDIQIYIEYGCGSRKECTE